MNPLNRSEFEAALKKGQGRALRHVNHFGMGDYKDLVLDACLHNKNYDVQIDPSRAPWLFSMFHDTPFYGEFREAILENIDASDSKDFFQMGSLLYEMAATGDAVAKQKLKEMAFENATMASEDEDIIGNWVDFQSSDEFIELAKVLGKRLLDHPSDQPFQWLIPEERRDEFKKLLLQHAQNDPIVRAYWEYLEKRDQDRTPRSRGDWEAEKKARHDRYRQQHSLDQILADARNKKWDYGVHYITFGRHALKEELEIIYTSLLTEEDPEVRMRLLWIFRRAELPELDPVLFQWARGAERGVRSAVIPALAQIQDERVHQLALEKVKAAELLGPDNETIGLFEKNYEQSDAGLIAAGLHSIEANDPVDAHELGYHLIEISDIQSDAGLVDALKWVYEWSPCTFCRYKAVIELKKYNAIDEQMKEELPFDANEDVHKFADSSGTAK